MIAARHRNPHERESRAVGTYPARHELCEQETVSETARRLNMQSPTFAAHSWQSGHRIGALDSYRLLIFHDLTRRKCDTLVKVPVAKSALW